MSSPLLEVKDLRTEFRTRDGVVRAVNSISFELGAGEALGFVGESGSGKSVTALSILRLFGPFTDARIGGQVIYDGQDLSEFGGKKMRKIRGREIGMVFQDPLTSLNPLMPVGQQVAECIRLHESVSHDIADRRATELLELVGIPDPKNRSNDLPHSFSGGMRQRIMIAIAVACRPRLLIADEPTTALDVTVQAQILLLLNDLQRELGMALIMISHDFGVIAATCDRVNVMYGGRIVEQAFTKELFRSANHPYTEGLLKLVPSLDQRRGEQLVPISGQPPDAFETLPGCSFAPRCPHAVDVCQEKQPDITVLGPSHGSACWKADERRTKR